MDSQSTWQEKQQNRSYEKMPRMKLDACIQDLDYKHREEWIIRHDEPYLLRLGSAPP